jgi:hypothetical protein
MIGALVGAGIMVAQQAASEAVSHGPQACARAVANARNTCKAVAAMRKDISDMDEMSKDLDKQGKAMLADVKRRLKDMRNERQGMISKLNEDRRLFQVSLTLQVLTLIPVVLGAVLLVLSRSSAEKNVVDSLVRSLPKT